MTSVTLADGTEVTVDTAEGRAFVTLHGPHGERVECLDPRSAACAEAFELAERAEGRDHAAECDDDPGPTDADCPAPDEVDPREWMRHAAAMSALGVWKERAA